MNFAQFKELVIAKAQAMGISDYELYYQAEESTSVSAFQHEINQFTSSVEGGVCFRCIVGGKMGYASTEALNESEAAAIVERAAENAAVLEAEEPVFLGEGGKTYQAVADKTYPLPTTEALIAKVLATQEAIYKADPAVIDGSSTQGISERSSIAIVNSKGLDLSTEVALSGLVVAAVVTNGQEMANDYQIKLGQLDTLDSDALTKKAAETALGKLGGEVAPTGQYPVIFDSDAMSDLLQTFCGIFSAENAQQGLSLLKDKEGTMVAAPCVTIVDDPLREEGYATCPFDAEGVAAYKKTVVEAGKLMTLLHNRKTAAKAGVKSTGNASKASYAAPVKVAPTNFYMEPGDISFDALVEKLGKGLIITDVAGLHSGANAVSGDFSLLCSGFLVEDGKQGRAVKQITVAGNFLKLLESIEAIADDLKFPSNPIGCPSVLVKGMSIAGK